MAQKYLNSFNKLENPVGLLHTRNPIFIQIVGLLHTRNPIFIQIRQAITWANITLDGKKLVPRSTLKFYL